MRIEIQRTSLKWMFGEGGDHRWLIIFELAARWSLDFPPLQQLALSLPMPPLLKRGPVLNGLSDFRVAGWFYPWIPRVVVRKGNRGVDDIAKLFVRFISLEGRSIPDCLNIVSPIRYLFSYFHNDDGHVNCPCKCIWLGNFGSLDDMSIDLWGIALQEARRRLKAQREEVSKSKAVTADYGRRNHG